MDCSPPGSSVDGIFQARILDWVAIFLLQRIRNRTLISFVSCTGRQIIYHCVTWEVPLSLLFPPKFLAILYLLTLLFVPFTKRYQQVQLVQLLSHVRLFATPWTAARQASLSITNSWSLLKLMSTELVTPSNHLILCHPLLLLTSIFPSIRVFSKESVLCIRWPKYWSFSFSISPSNEHPGLISFRMDWLDLLAVQGTLKSFLPYHSSKASILWLSTFFIVQLSHPYMTTGKTKVLTRWNFVGNVMSLLFNMLSRLVIAFLARGKQSTGYQIAIKTPISFTFVSGLEHGGVVFVYSDNRNSSQVSA